MLVSSTLAFSQVIIGDDIGTAQDKTSVLLEFSKAEKKGIILPYVTKLPATPTEGTILLDASTPTDAKVKYYNGNWVDLTNDTTTAADLTNILVNQPKVTEESNAKVIIGAENSNADGVLILEHQSKAMVLPTVDTVEDVVNPSPGMVVYLSKDKLLALYNGEVWSFWEADN